MAGVDYRFCYGYKPAGLYRETYPSNRQVTTSGFDAAGRPTGVTVYASGVKHDPSGSRSQITSGNGGDDRVYQPLQIKSIEAAKNGSLWKLENFYCASEATSCASNNGNVVSQRQTIGAISWPTAYTYDAVNRLTGATATPSGVTGWSHAYTYGNQYGNMTLVDSVGVVPSDLKCNSYDSATNRCNAAGFGYDDSGNLISASGRSMTYDAENRQVTLTDGGTTQYLYDAEGRRVRKVSSGQTTTYVYDAKGQLAAEYGGSTANAPACSTCYMTTDHLGSTRLVTNEQGTSVRLWDYTPFGWEINGSYGRRPQISGYVISDSVQPKFTGKERDAETGLDYFGARYYGGAQGRFTSPDQPFLDQRPEDPQSWNLYTYGRNNPLRYIDRLGTCTKSADAKPDTPAGSICADPSTLTVSSGMVETIKRNESLQTTAYIAPEGFDKDGNRNGRGLTVGYGHLIKAGDGIKEGDTITEEQAAAFLQSDLTSFESNVKSALGTTQSSQQEFDALVDMSYGLGSISKTTTPRLIQAIGKQDYEAMGNELRTDRATNGIVLPGLQNRSTQRENIFRSGDYSPVTIYPKKRQ